MRSTSYGLPIITPQNTKKIMGSLLVISPHPELLSKNHLINITEPLLSLSTLGKFQWCWELQAGTVEKDQICMINIFWSSEWPNMYLTNHNNTITKDEYVLCKNIEYLSFTSTLTEEVTSELFITA